MMKFDDILVHHIGRTGRYQVFLFVLLSTVTVSTSLFTISVVFIGGVRQDYHCQLPPNVTFRNQSSLADAFTANFTVGKCQYPDYLGSGGYSDGDFGANETAFHGHLVDCHSWSYDREGSFYSSLVTQYELTCEREWLIPLTQTVFMAGWLCGNFIFGSLSDRFGRMTVIPPGYILQALLGLSLPFIPDYYAALVFRFLLGAVAGGTDLVRFVLCMEFCGKKWRPLVGLLSHSGFNCGLMLAAGIAYAMEPVNHIILQVIFGCVPILFISIKWLVPESPRWLVTRGKFDEARLIIRKVARLNGRPIPREEVIIFDGEDGLVSKGVTNEKETQVVSENKKYSVLDLFRTRNLRRISFASFLVWFCAAFIFYGFLFLNKDLGANVYINTVISGGTGVIAAFVCVPILNYFGRRLTMMTFQFIMTMALAIAIFLVDKPDFDTVVIILVAIGKFCNILVFDAVYLHSAEVFPTCIRSLGVGMGSLFARVGALTAPLVSNLAMYWTKLPLVVFTVFALISTLVELLLPETLGRPLPETIEDGEEFARFTLKDIFPFKKKTLSQKDTEDHQQKC